MRVNSFGPVVVVACEAVRDAVRFMRGAERSAIAQTFTKANGSPVTVADLVVQAFVASRRARSFSGDPLVAEEDASVLRTGEVSQVREQVVRLVGQMLPGTDAEGWFHSKAELEIFRGVALRIPHELAIGRADLSQYCSPNFSDDIAISEGMPVALAVRRIEDAKHARARHVKSRHRHRHRGQS